MILKKRIHIREDTGDISASFRASYNQGFGKSSKLNRMIFDELKAVTKRYREARFLGDFPKAMELYDPLDLAIRNPDIFKRLKSSQEPLRLFKSVKKHLRSLRASYEYSKVSWEEKQSFIRKVQNLLLIKNPTLLENDYPYSIFRKNGCGHYIMWGTNKLTPMMFEGSKKTFGFDFNDVVFYFSNKQKDKSVKEIPHVHIIAFNPAKFSLEE